MRMELKGEEGREDWYETRKHDISTAKNAYQSVPSSKPQAEPQASRARNV